MPKSYLPLLEKFKHRKIAREIKIFPANIGWDKGRMIASPKTSILRGGRRPIKPGATASREIQVTAEKSLSSEAKMARGAAALFLLKSFLVFNTKPHQSIEHLDSNANRNQTNSKKE